MDGDMSSDDTVGADVIFSVFDGLCEGTTLVSIVSTRN